MNTIEEFKTEVRRRRGVLYSMDDALANIFIHGTTELREWVLNRKDVGVGKAADIAITLNPTEQKDFISWVLEKPRKKVEIDVKLLGY